ncbi:MAG: hypothetical protein SFX73_07680 [Kofleriaceae bacterium]|nr:hypothetical protein [Kofleriaceae bacterium]
MTLRAAALIAAAALGLAPRPAAAWEPETTHAGLAEQAALASRLHQRLTSIGFTGGLFEPLTIPPADAPSLMNALRLLSPSHGSVPDARGRQAAIAWLSAGAALADVPAAHGANHFYDPQTKSGWHTPSRGLLDNLSDKAREAVGRAALPTEGVPAPDWVTHKSNPFNLANFYAQYAKAISAKTPGERSRHMAAALIAAGSILHTLGDLGAPSRVRGDEAAMFEPLGAGPDDLGSRFERIAALAYGRLGVPPPSRVVTRPTLREYFIAPAPTANKSDGGLVDLIARSYFSTNTLPATTRVGSETKPQLARNEPALPSRLNLMAASRDDGTTLRNTNGTCLSRYKVERGVLSFWMDDECMLDQIDDILPEVAAYEAGLLDYLLRGELTINIADTVAVSGKGLGPGTIDILVEDDRGVRTSLVSAPTAQGDVLAKVPTPASGTRIVAVYRGVDDKGQPIVAVGAMPFSR